MNLKKCILLLVLILISTFTFGQKSIDDQVNDLTQKVNIRLTETNDHLKLSEDQETQVNELHKEFVLVKNEKRKKIKDEKKLWKALYPKLKETNNAIKALLTEDQLAAFNSYKAK